MIFREQGREREINTHWLLPILTLTRDQTCNLLVCRVLLKPSELLLRDFNCFLKAERKPHTF